MLLLSKRQGVEGPRHDPYGYTDRVVEKGGYKYLLHDGIVMWISVNGHRVTSNAQNDDWVCNAFEEMTGLTVAQFDRAYGRIHGPHAKCTKCGSKKLKGVRGYPGEGFEICTKCESIVNYYFNEGAII